MSKYLNNNKLSPEEQVLKDFLLKVTKDPIPTLTKEEFFKVFSKIDFLSLLVTDYLTTKKEINNNPKTYEEVLLLRLNYSEPSLFPFLLTYNN